MTLISYRGEIVAAAGGTRFYFSPRLQELDTDDPLVRFVAVMIAFAFAVAEGTAPGPYTDERAERFARLLLIDDAEFRAFDAERFDDVLIAGHFGVPVEQVDEMRHDLVLMD
jgi:hypothetical protein